ncbi:hypothetical protein E3P92_00197 [Wallemia ichthyophaga]|uniref:Riboflavin kinase n=2 Tax=Wallemia ichthyophaga TaxID=245174 RepID=A0A4T0L7W9_WALIC|nr:Riboflavin kinase [Wallemia ichthyophaga EXF-994]TIA75323.1 hypothetical protein E3P91_00472 [Wallemia ichthyophaga]EOR04886.1 Riboflavin kinase [Wallemia ichthyophaga EXF-994]TIA84129.1 hypothetical protein E3P98_00340 [Wallemia ichthyophaga]TIA93515.1 hypothetical protein E3P97_00890 [Wallemia ichthyophaga]TIB00712.1 hypothetical protein E3P95_01592 [Wallemia ichthyophaga]
MGEGRALVVGSEPISPPFPLRMQGYVQRGFGRGSKDLGIPTANLPEESYNESFKLLDAAKNTGVYYGWAKVDGVENAQVHPMAMSVGWNPYYKNEKLTAEVHIMHNYDMDFYGKNMRVIVTGYVRPELDYSTLEALIEDIEFDKKVAIHSLDRQSYKLLKSDSFFN